MAIQKRYQYYSRLGIVWTPWFNISSDDSQLERLKREEKYQFGTKYLNEYRVI